MKNGKRRLILVTNDDGIASPGIRAAVEAALPLGRVIVVAPKAQQSAMGRSHCGNPRDRLTPVVFEVGGERIEAYAIEASPALALSHGVSVLCHGKMPELVIAGINYGENLGTNTTISGTIGAALQAAAHGVRALAVSLQTDPADHHSYAPRDWAAATAFARRFAAALLGKDWPPDMDVLKVDVPADASADTPWVLTRQSRQSYFSRLFDSPASDARLGDARVGCFVSSDAIEQGSDIEAVLARRLVSVTPLSVDLTSRVDFSELDAALRERQP